MGTGRAAYRIEVGARKLAAWLTPPWLAKRRELRDHLRELFAAYGIDCVLDVGANRGQYSRFLRYEVGFRGLVISFEPIRELAQRLAERARYERRWIVKPFALGARRQTARLNVMVRSGFSSMLEPDASHTDAFAEKNVVARIDSIEVRTLDEIFDELVRTGGFSRPYLKLDTQGYDLEVLRGAARTLPHVFALQSELSFIPIYRGMPDWREAVQAVTSAGFEVSGFFTVTRDRALRLIEADCVFVKPARTP